MIKVAFYEQQRIGSNQAFLGHISLRWKYIQQKWYEEITSNGRKLPKQKTPRVRATNLYRRLMFLALNRWQIRNEVYHDRVSKYSYLRDREVSVVKFGQKQVHEVLEKSMKPVNVYCKEANLFPFMIVASYKETSTLSAINHLLRHDLSWVNNCTSSLWQNTNGQKAKT